jgi:uncharacterized membrane-anchored protein
MQPEIQRILDNIAQRLALLTVHRIGADSDAQLADLQAIAADLKEVATNIALAQFNMQAQLDALTAHFVTRDEIKNLR